MISDSSALNDELLPLVIQLQIHSAALQNGVQRLVQELTDPPAGRPTRRGNGNNR